MKSLKKMYYLVLAIVFVMYNCSTDEITTQVEENDNLSFKKMAQSASGQAGLIFNYGEGSLNGYQSFSFQVTMDVYGNVSGSWQSNYNDSMDDTKDINTHGTIDCVIFDDNRAIMAGTLTVVNEGGYWEPVQVGTYAYFEVVDNGEGENSLPDEFSDIYFGLGTLYCGADFGVPLSYINNGNIQVNN